MSAEFLIFGEWLKRTRLERRMSQEMLAGKAGITKSYVSALERGKPHPSSARPRQPDLDVVDRLALALGVALDEARQAAGYAPPPRSALSRSVPTVPNASGKKPGGENPPAIPAERQCLFETWAAGWEARITERLEHQERLLEELRRTQSRILELLLPQSDVKTKPHKADQTEGGEG